MGDNILQQENITRLLRDHRRAVGYGEPVYTEAPPTNSGGSFFTSSRFIMPFIGGLAGAALVYYMARPADDADEETAAKKRKKAMKYALGGFVAGGVAGFMLQRRMASA